MTDLCFKIDNFDVKNTNNMHKSLKYIEKLEKQERGSRKHEGPNL